MKRSFFIVFQMTCLVAYSKGLDSNYFNFYTNDIVLRTYTGTDMFYIKQVNASNKVVLFKPNQSLFIGLGVSYKWLVIGFSVTAADLNNQDVYGASNRTDLGIGASISKHYANVKYINFKGFYISNYEELGLRTSKTGLIPNLPNLRLELLVAEYNYYTNGNRFAYSPYFNGNTIMKKNAGSLVLSASFSYYNLSNDSSFTPNVNRFSNEEQLKKLTSYAPYLSVGYGYNFVLGNNFNVIIIPKIGLGMERQEYLNKINELKYLSNLSLKIDGFTGLMWNTRNYFISMTGNGQLLSHNLRIVSFETFDANFLFTFGYRIQPKSSIKWIGNKIGL